MRESRHIPIGPSQSVATSSIAIVLDGGQRSALAVVRSLGRRGVRVLVAESMSSATPVAFTSRFTQGTFRYPDPGKNAEGFVNWLVDDLAPKFPGAVLMPMSDWTVPLVLRAGTRIGSLRTALPTSQSYEAVTDKSRLVELAKSAGVRVPLTWVASHRTLKDVGGLRLSYPVVIKPSRSVAATSIGTVVKRGVSYASTPEELVRIIRSLLFDDSDELLVQEYVHGVGVGVFALYDHGDPVLFFAHRRIREKPPTGGVSVLSESIPVPEEGKDAVRRLLEPLNWHGVAMLEFKMDAAGRVWLIEVNARFWGSLQLAVDCNADFCWLLYQMAAERQPEAPASYAVGRRLRWWLGDLDSLYARLRNSKLTPTFGSKAVAIGEFLVPWRTRTRNELLRLYDLRPGVTEFLQYLAATYAAVRSVR